MKSTYFYLRDERNKAPVGVLYLMPIVCNDSKAEISVGISVCSKHDVWDREMAIKIAAGRALKSPVDVVEQQFNSPPVLNFGNFVTILKRRHVDLFRTNRVFFDLADRIFGNKKISIEE